MPFPHHCNPQCRVLVLWVEACPYKTRLPPSKAAPIDIKCGSWLGGSGWHSAVGPFDWRVWASSTMVPSCHTLTQVVMAMAEEWADGRWPLMYKGHRSQHFGCQKFVARMGKGTMSSSAPLSPSTCTVTAYESLCNALRSAFTCPNKNFCERLLAVNAGTEDQQGVKGARRRD
jgi:hypothetical protein